MMMSIIIFWVCAVAGFYAVHSEVFYFNTKKERVAAGLERDYYLYDIALSGMKQLEGIFSFKRRDDIMNVAPETIQNFLYYIFVLPIVLFETVLLIPYLILFKRYKHYNNSLISFFLKDFIPGFASSFVVLACIITILYFFNVDMMTTPTFKYAGMGSFAFYGVVAIPVFVRRQKKNALPDIISGEAEIELEYEDGTTERAQMQVDEGTYQQTEQTQEYNAGADEFEELLTQQETKQEEAQSDTDTEAQSEEFETADEAEEEVVNVFSNNIEAAQILEALSNIDMKKHYLKIDSGDIQSALLSLRNEFAKIIVTANVTDFAKYKDAVAVLEKFFKKFGGILEDETYTIENENYTIPASSLNCTHILYDNMQEMQEWKAYQALCSKYKVDGSFRHWHDKGLKDITNLFSSKIATAARKESMKSKNNDGVNECNKVKNVIILGVKTRLYNIFQKQN